MNKAIGFLEESRHRDVHFESGLIYNFSIRNKGGKVVVVEITYSILRPQSASPPPVPGPPLGLSNFGHRQAAARGDTPG